MDELKEFKKFGYAKITETFLMKQNGEFLICFTKADNGYWSCFLSKKEKIILDEPCAMEEGTIYSVYLENIENFILALNEDEENAIKNKEKYHV